MNFLAHILLAPDTESRVGALLGDFVRSSSEIDFGARNDGLIAENFPAFFADLADYARVRRARATL